MRRIFAPVDIAAPPAAAWAVITDFKSYPEWNPFIRRIAGDLRVGAKLQVTVKPQGQKEMSFKPTLIAVEPGRELRWLGRVLIPGIFDGEHSFTIEPAAGGCRVLHEERFGGFMVPLYRNMLDLTERSFFAANEALKKRVENQG
jgi:hypothetical protein